MIAKEFTRHHAGYASEVSVEIRALVQRTTSALVEVLRNYAIGKETDTDLAIMQLLPTMCLEDPETDLELRKRHTSAICAAKISHLGSLNALMQGESDRVVIPFELVDCAVQALADLRIFVAARLEKHQWEHDPQTSQCQAPRAALMLSEVLNFLTWWQASLLEVLGFSEQTP